MDLDQEFHRLFPHLNNLRYMQNVLVPFTSSEELTSQKFEEDVISLCKQMNIYEDLHCIEPGIGDSIFSCPILSWRKDFVPYQGWNPSGNSKVSLSKLQS